MGQHGCANYEDDLADGHAFQSDDHSALRYLLLRQPFLADDLDFWLSCILGLDDDLFVDLTLAHPLALGLLQSVSFIAAALFSA
jgi:hypothetical protein